MQIVIEIPEDKIPSKQCYKDVLIKFVGKQVCEVTLISQIPSEDDTELWFDVLPEGHGRLVDGDSLWNKMSCYSDDEGAGVDYSNDDVNPIILRDSAMEVIENAQTIIPADKGEEV